VIYHRISQHSQSIAIEMSPASGDGQMLDQWRGNTAVRKERHEKTERAERCVLDILSVDVVALNTVLAVPSRMQDVI
jgi:hypothetical protein